MGKWGEHMAWNCELLTVLLGSPVKGHGYSGTAVLHTRSIWKKKKKLKIAAVFHIGSTLYTFMPMHTVHWSRGREKVPTACNRCLNPLTNLGSNSKSRCCRAQKQTVLYGSAGSNTQFTHCTFYFLSLCEGTIELARFSKQSQKLWQGVNRNRASFHEIISSAFYIYTYISLLGNKGHNSFILFAH